MSITESRTPRASAKSDVTRFGYELLPAAPPKRGTKQMPVAEADALMAALDSGRWVRSKATFDTRLKASGAALSVKNKLAKAGRIPSAKALETRHVELGDKKFAYAIGKPPVK